MNVTPSRVGSSVFPRREGDHYNSLKRTEHVVSKRASLILHGADVQHVVPAHKRVAVFVLQLAVDVFLSRRACVNERIRREEAFRSERDSFSCDAFSGSRRKRGRRRRRVRRRRGAATAAPKRKKKDRHRR